MGDNFAAVPIPVRFTFCGLPTSLSVTLSAAVRIPLALGLHVILKVQLAPAAKEAPQVWVCGKAALVPVTAIPVIVRAMVPTLVRVTAFAALEVPVATAPKLRLNGENFAAAPNASCRSAQILRPNEAIHWYAMRYWKSRGVEIYDWGGEGTYKEKYGCVPHRVPWFTKSRYKFVSRLRDEAKKLFGRKQRFLGWLRAERAGSGAEYKALQNE